MITVQDIKEKTFEKAVFGGYDMASVDTFLEEISADLALLLKENATLKGKMKVLVDKVEEYRSNEDAIRMAVISAQRLGNMIEAEAKDKAAAIVADAEKDALRVAQNARAEADLEKSRLEEAKKASAQFVENMELLCNRQLSFLKNVSAMDFMQERRAAAAAVPTAAPAAVESAEIHETVKSIEETVAKVADVPVSDVRPVINAAPAVDDMPTQAYGTTTDPSDLLEQTAQFSFNGFES